MIGEERCMQARKRSVATAQIQVGLDPYIYSSEASLLHKMTQKNDKVSL